MPVLGGPAVAASGGTGGLERGVIVPKGSLDRWAQVTAETSAALFEISVIGDSTTYGDSTGAEPDFAWMHELRDRALAAGLPDGGYGLHHPDDRSKLDFNADPDGYPKVSAATGFGGGPAASIFGFCSATPGDSITLQGKGTGFRLTTYRSAGVHGALTYSVDGGTAVPVDLTATVSGTVAYVAVPIHVGGLTSGVHSVTVVNTSTGGKTTAEFNIEWLNDSGVVFHRDALSGAASATFADSVLNEARSVSDVPVRFGLVGVTGSTTSDTNTVNGYAWGAAPGPRPQYRNTGLVLIQIGTNDMAAASATDSTDQRSQPYLENVALACRTARAAGADVLLLSPPFSAATHPQGQRQTGRFKSALIEVALSHGCVYGDFQDALGWDVSAWSGRGYGPGTVTNPHLPGVAYRAEADFVWDRILAPALA